MLVLPAASNRFFESRSFAVLSFYDHSERVSFAVHGKPGVELEPDGYREGRENLCRLKQRPALSLFVGFADTKGPNS